MAARPRGFTIIELMIATAIFAVILLVVTAGVLSFTRQYYRGVIASRTQNTARQLIDDVTRDIQFQPGSVSDLKRRKPSAPYGATVGYCIGQAQRYSFALNSEVTSGGGLSGNQGPHGLISDTTSSCSTDTAALDATSTNALTQDPNTGTAPLNAHELLGEHMRLSEFKIEDASADLGTGGYKITVRVIYGDNDVLCRPSGSGCSDIGVADSGDPSTLKCKADIGNTFCAVAAYTTTVKSRVN